MGVSIPPPPPIPYIISEGSIPPVTVVRDGLLADIEAGYRLRPVDASKRGGREKTLTGMAAALANALNMRNRVMQFSGAYVHVCMEFTISKTAFLVTCVLTMIYMYIVGQIAHALYITCR